MPLQNRVTPDARIIASSWRGDFMGNRGGRIHDPETKTLLKRKWASRRWIICVTKFRGRQRKVMGHSYTELFFLDEVSALAAGHRPCFECRRKAANEFTSAWVSRFGRPDGSMADAMDKILHEERIGECKALTKSEISKLPDGAMISVQGRYFAKKKGIFMQWSGDGYKQTGLNPDKTLLLTPSSILAVLEFGYHPVWHESSN